MFPLSRITEMWIGPDLNIDLPRQKVSGDKMVEALRKLPALRTLSIYVEYIQSLSTAPEREVSSSESESIHGPKLNIIRMSCDMDRRTVAIPQQVSEFMARFSGVRPAI